MGGDLPARVPVRWELADDEALSRASSRAARRRAEAAWAHSVHAEPAALEPGRWYWYRFSALGEQSAVGRTRTAPARRRRGDAALRHRQLPALRRRPLRGLAPRRRRRPRPGRSSSATTSTSTRRARTRSAALEGGETFTLDAVPRALRDLQERRRAAGSARGGAVARGLGRPRSRRTTTPACAARTSSVDIAGAPRGRLSRLLGAHAVPQFGASGRRRHAHRRPARLGPAGAHPPPRRPPVPRSAGLSEARPRRLEHGRRSRSARRSPIRARTLLGAEQEQWLAAGWDLDRPWNLLAQQTLMARFSWPTRRIGGGAYWTDGWDGYAPARKRLLGDRRAKKVPGVVVLGGDVHSNYVADLKAGLRRPGVAGRRQRVLRHLDLEPVGGAVAHRPGARVQPARPLRRARPARLRELRARREAAAREPADRRPAGRSGRAA